jgi:hypothetical protein
MYAGYELAFGDHTRFSVRKSEALQEWFDGESEKALLWSYIGGDFDPHPGYVALFSNKDASSEGLGRLRQVLAEILKKRDFRNGDLVDGCTVCFAPRQMGPRVAILIIEGDCGMITDKGWTEILENVAAELKNSTAD